MELEHLSYSSIDRYLRCQRDWRYHYLDKVSTLVSTNLLFGGAIHNAVETRILDKGVAITDAWHAGWEKKLEECGGQDNIWWQNETPESLYNLGIKMLTYPDTSKLVDALVPLSMENKPAIETYVELQVPGVPIPIIGYIDLIEKNGIPADFKTSNKSWNQQRANDELQPVFYMAALNQLGYDLNPEWRFTHYVFVKTKTPQIQAWPSQRDLNQVFWLFGLIREVWEAIQKGAFAPTGVGSWKCQPKYCEYYQICRGKK